MCDFYVLFFFSSRRRHTRCALVTGVQTCALPILVHHDRRLAPERTRDAAGNWIAEADAPAILALSASNLATYDIGHARPGSRYAERWPEQAAVYGTHIPTLAEVIARAETLSGGTVRSEARRVGKESVSACRSRWPPYH